MRRFYEEIPYTKQHPLTHQLFDEHSIFFDIETTGFSPAASTLYLIGCARRTDQTLILEQFFAEKPEEEPALLSAFFQLLYTCRTILSFNGVGFDIPYLTAKARQYHMAQPFAALSTVDLFQSLSPVKFLLGLKNYKQKTVEAFLGLEREDTMSGGDLIRIYQDYVRRPTDDALHLLCIHNYEDVRHMVDLLPILSYEKLLDGHYTLLSHRVDSYRAYDGSEGEEWIATLQNDYPVPRQLSWQQDGLYLLIGETRTSLRIPVYEGELHYFYPNYKDYYYLKKEDMAVHKSVAAFVDKQFRENARASNCYTRKSGRFLPQYTDLMQPEFRIGCKDKIRYFELTEAFGSSDAMCRRYIDHILDAMRTIHKK